RRRARHRAVRHRAGGRGRVRALPLRQSADDVADAGHLRRLCRDLHGAAQAGHAAEHRHRRRLGRDAAGAWLGRRRQRGERRAARAVPDHLRLDAAALLVARVVPHRRLSEIGPADAAGHARAGVHAAEHPALHDPVGGRFGAAVPDPDERAAVSRVRARARCGLRRLCVAPVALVFRRAGAAYLRLLDLLPGGAFRGAARRPFHELNLSAEDPIPMTRLDVPAPLSGRWTRRAALVAMLSGALWLAGCQSRPEFRNTDVTGADFAQDFQLTGHDGKRYSLADFRGKEVVIFFGYTQCPDVCPSTMSELAEVMKTLGDDADRVQVLFVT